MGVVVLAGVVGVPPHTASHEHSFSRCTPFLGPWFVSLWKDKIKVRVLEGHRDDSEAILNGMYS